MRINNTQLKILTGSIVTESRLDKISKLQILNFVKEASPVQVKGLLLDGEMYFNISKNGERIIEKRFEQVETIFEEKYREFETKAKKFLQYGIPILLTSLTGVGPIISAALVYLYRSSTDTCTNKCGGAISRDAVCYNKCYIAATERVIAKIKSDISSLSKIDDPLKQAKISKNLRSELSKYTEKLEMFKKRLKKALG